jgi:hypothetical protein
MASTAERFPGAALFLNEQGQLNEVARRAWFRAQADLMYLSLWRQLGPNEAGARVCEEFGHEPRGGLCERCGQRV